MIIKREDGRVLSSLPLCVNNANIHKTATISGSEDNKNWYAISDNLLLSYLYDNTSTQTYKVIYFPPVHYTYLRLQVNDSVSSPIKINKVGNFEGSERAGRLEELTVPEKIKQIEDVKNKTTKLIVTFDQPQVINRIEFKIAAPSLFKRRAYG